MANGLRVIGGNADGSVDAISFSSESALINPDDIEEIKNAIQKLLSENWTAEQKINLSTKCKEKFSSENFEHNIEKTLLYYGNNN
jgi:glycosyltransferase involved in cell wall biosynthesis